MVKVRTLLSAVVALCLVVVGVTFAGAASAHTPDVKVTCDKLSVELTNYVSHSTQKNHVKVTVNGAVVADEDFVQNFSRDFTAPDRYTSFSYEVVVTAWDDPSGSHGWSFTETGTSAPCEKPVEEPKGSFTQVCTATGAEVTIGPLDNGTYQNVVWTLTHGGTPVVVAAGDKVAVAPNVALDLSYTADGGKSGSVKTDTSKEACPPVEVKPSGSFTTECIATGAQADIGELSEGDFSEGTFQLVSGDFSVTVVGGQQNVAVPPSSTITLQYVPAEGPAVTLDTEQSPAACPPTGDVTKTSVPATGTVVAPGQTIAYTVTVKNTGQVPVTNAPVVDTLPNFVTAVAGTVSDSGVVSADGRSITWTVTLAPGASKTLTYTGLVAANAPAGTALVNKATFLLKESTTTHEVGSRDLTVLKAVTPTGSVQFGDTLTYTLTVTATGNLPQTAVVVTDQVPTGTTYTAGSAACDAGTCTPSFTGGIVRWELGNMAAGSVRTVTFQVTVDTPEADEDGSIPAVEVRNAGAASSTEVPTRPSNEVITPVTAVQGTKTGPDEEPDVQPGPKPGTDVLASTGAGLPLPVTITLGGLFLLAGIALIMVGRPVPRRIVE
jgi:uncharacterized repeat protein (TIGR01451 family)